MYRDNFYFGSDSDDSGDDEGEMMKWKPYDGKMKLVGKTVKIGRYNPIIGIVISAVKEYYSIEGEEYYSFILTIDQGGEENREVQVFNFDNVSVLDDFDVQQILPPDRHFPPGIAETMGPFIS